MIKNNIDLEPAKKLIMLAQIIFLTNTINGFGNFCKKILKAKFFDILNVCQAVFINQEYYFTNPFFQLKVSNNKIGNMLKRECVSNVFKLLMLLMQVDHTNFIRSDENLTTSAYLIRP